MSHMLNQKPEQETKIAGETCSQCPELGCVAANVKEEAGVEMLEKFALVAP